jgi:LAO/AO transport system kinase
MRIVSCRDLAEGILAHDRHALAQAITLVESTRDDHRALAEELIERLLPATGKSIRLGISGAPGVGKSTFIEAFGLQLVAAGKCVAVLAIDPSSRRAGGSILGDKTRMTELSRASMAFIRPSPNSGALGGVALRTRESLLLCEAAGFDVVIVETVGVGQSETAVADMVDLFCLLLLPNAGDELQGIKKGIVELAELIIVNKADGELRDAATRTVADYRSALRMLRPLTRHWTTEVIPVSSTTPCGMEAVWSAIERHQAAMRAAGERNARRNEQATAALWSDLSDQMVSALKRHPRVLAELATIEGAVRAGTMTPMAGTRLLIRLFSGSEVMAKPLE